MCFGSVDVSEMFVFICVVLDIFPVVFEGGKLVVNKALSSHFQISHTMTMSSLQPSGYKFGCTYVGTKQYSPSEASRVTVTVEGLKALLRHLRGECCITFRLICIWSMNIASVKMGKYACLF